MSFGTVMGFKSKKALADAVKSFGADAVFVFDTAMRPHNKGTVAVSELADTSAVIVGPDVYTDRRWYANVKRNAKTGEIRIV